MFPVNCYVLWDETKEAVVIDPGCFYDEEKQALKNFIIANGLTVKHLLNTHLHLEYIIARRIIACFRAMSCFKEVSAGPI